MLSNVSFSPMCLLSEPGLNITPHSHHPVAHKAAVVRTLMCRASALSSNGVERVAEEKKVMEELRDNGYPSGFVHRHSDCRAPRRREDDQRVTRTSLTLPYISGLAETVRRILRPLDIKVVFCPLHTLRHQLVRPKDPVPMDQRTGVVYQIPCSDCPKVIRVIRTWAQRRKSESGSNACFAGMGSMQWVSG